MLFKNTLSLIFFGFVYVFGMDAPDNDLKMGIELETSSIKSLFQYVDDKDVGEEKFFSFLPSTSQNKAVWVIETDTLDSKRDQNDDKKYYRNLEFKTIGGFGQLEINQYAGDAQNIFLNLASKQQKDEEIEIGEDFIIEMGASIKGKLEYTSALKSKNYLKINPKCSSGAVRPQITYQIPFKLILLLFQHMSAIGHEGIRDFLKIMEIESKEAITSKVSASIKKNEPDEETQKLIDKVKSLTKNKNFNLSKNIGINTKHAEESKEFFANKIAPIYKKIESEDLRGFYCLFFYYFHQLFSDKSPIVTTEPGLKPRLSIMSRVSFVDMYGTLKEGDKEKFQMVLVEVFGKNFADVANYNLNNYKDDEEQIYIPEITALSWIYSILHPQHYVKRGYRRVDQLSNLPKLFDPSMGKISIQDSEMLPLLEVRGYAKLNGGLLFTAIENTIKEESEWFFSLKKN